MTPEELLNIIQLGENSRVQFKERLMGEHALSQEFAAFANGKGGMLVISVNDKTGALKGLSFDEIRAYNQLAVHAATNNLFPPIQIETEQVRLQGEILMITRVPEGSNKPYKDKNGAMWMKNGSDKRRITSNDEIARLLQESGTLFADEMVIHTTSADDMDKRLVTRFLKKKFGDAGKRGGLNNEQLLTNLHLMSGEHLTLTGLILLGKRPQYFRPECTAKCLALPGITLIAETYLDNEPSIIGTTLGVYEMVMNFFERNLRKIPSGKGFNVPPMPEIPVEALQELVVNAFVHRNYFIRAEIRIAIFTDRIEIISPGTLPNSLTIANIKAGTSIPRNPILQQNAQYLLPYKGWGTGIRWALEFYPAIDFVNDTERQMFTAIIQRNVLQRSMALS